MYKLGTKFEWVWYMNLIVWDCGGILDGGNDTRVI